MQHILGEAQTNWFEKHLHWTVTLNFAGVYLLLLLLLNFAPPQDYFSVWMACRVEMGVVGGWMLHQKGKSLLWLISLLIPFPFVALAILLCLPNRNTPNFYSTAEQNQGPSSQYSELVQEGWQVHPQRAEDEPIKTLKIAIPHANTTHAIDGTSEFVRPRCGNYVPDDWKACPNWGKRFIQTVEYYCSKCGSRVEEDWNMCVRCGELLAKSA